MPYFNMDCLCVYAESKSADLTDSSDSRDWKNIINPFTNITTDCQVAYQYNDRKSE